MIGIDEVGRGCWAGPMLVVAARETGIDPPGLTDSKAISKSKRTKLYPKIIENYDIGEGWVSPAEIDSLGLTKATILGVERALNLINAIDHEEIIIDGNINYCNTRYNHARAVIKADSSFSAVSAASVYAKVTRDRYMSDLPRQYSKYAFDKHVGYGTKLHLQMLEKFGVSDIHRLSYKPIVKFL